MEIYNEIVINRPIEEVFNFLSDFANLSMWNYYVLKVSKITDGPITKGTVFHQVRKTDAQDFKIITFDFPKVVAIETLPPERYLMMRFTLIAQGDHTKVEDAWQVKIPRVVGWFAKKKIQPAVMENLQKLKALLETGKVTLQDGRIETLPVR
ncbi:Polyketide cyclase / dehydrase and lipid transport [Chryseolinea serpens]|uniref:Polyketide cyclase / dehydrase and lipid transport n=1 Tax=Chryseolinea serpens TaxID=947013 RepID=A0A1M5L4J8_9BACT|nr:SRPBCC family protein [Chryseolinea serpens]SHG59947.1 Polyketide cyclase / dehydrase and lipid transport [Chryseolinea serpens]